MTRAPRTMPKSMSIPIARLALDRRELLRLAGIGGAGLAGMSLPHRRGALAQEAARLPFWLPGGSPIFCETHQAVAAAYNAEHPESVVEVDCGAPDGWTERFLGAIAGGNAPEASVIWDTPVSFGVRGALRPLDDLLPTGEFTAIENWPAKVLTSSQFDGVTYGLPYTAGSYGMFYNQEMLDAKGIPSDPDSFPKTWDELRALSKEFTVWEGDKLVSAGYQPFSPDLMFTAPIWSALNGSQIYDAENQQYTIDSEQNIELMQYLLDWLDEEFKGDITLVQSSGAWQPYPNTDGAPPQFQAGNLLAFEWGTWGIGDFYSFGDPALEAWNVAKYPVDPGGSESVSGYWPNWLVIPANTDHPEQAFSYLDYLSGIGVEELFAVLPDLPTNVLVPVTTPTGIIENRGQEFADTIIAFFRDQFQIATSMWDSPVQAFAIDQLSSAIEQIQTKQTAPADALAEAQLACQAELESVLRDAS